MADNVPVLEIELQAQRPSVSMDLSNSSAAAREVIDDNAGAGVTDKTWSANKLTGMIGAVGTATLISGNQYRISL